MSEWRLFGDGVPGVSTREFHAARPRAAHLEDPHHAGRLHLALAFLADAAAQGARTLSDLGCGDGGLLSLAGHLFLDSWGYDFCPANLAGCAARGVRAGDADVFGGDRGRVKTGDAVAVTEVLEHLAGPHEALRWLHGAAGWLVASSPHAENGTSHAPEHAWAWDHAGYAAMITSAGWEIVRHEDAGMFQVVLAR